MTTEIINQIAESLLSSNDWLSEIRSIGYLSRPTGEGANSKLVVTDGEREIGITDREGNSGYIRFRSDQNFRVQKITAYTSCYPSSRYIYDLRLIVVVKTTAPENIAMLLSTQLNSMRPTIGSQTRVDVQSGGTNSLSVVKNEGGEQWNNNYRAMFIDFNMSFDWRDDCSLIVTDMACDNCVNIYDLGCFPHCDLIGIGQNSNQTGIWTLNTIFNGTSIIQEFAVVSGQEIKIPLSGLNESYQFNIQIKNTSGVVFTFIIENITYNCVQITLLP